MTIYRTAPSAVVEEYPTATALSLAGMVPEVVVEVGESPGMRVRLEMSTTRAAKIRRTVEGGTLTLRDTFTGSTARITGGVLRVDSTNIMVLGGTIGSISVNGKALNFGDEDEDPPGKVVVTVPKGTTITIEDPVGAHHLGDIAGALRVQNSVVGNVRAGKVLSVAANLSGTGDLEIAELLGGVCEVTSIGTGDFEVEEGTASSLALKTKGTGSMRFDGVAERADLMATGTGDIRVKRALVIVREVNRGVGTVKVKRLG